MDGFVVVGLEGADVDESEESGMGVDRGAGMDNARPADLGAGKTSGTFCCCCLLPAPFWVWVL